MNTITEIQNLLDLCKEQAAKIEQLEKKYAGELLDKSIQSVGAVLNEPEKPSLYASTARTKTFIINQDIAEHLRELGEMTSDFYKAGAYDTAAEIITNLPHEVCNGESLLSINGIGKGIANKIDLFLDTYFDEEEDDDDDESVDSCDGQILGDSDSDSDYDSDSDAGSTHDIDFRVVFNTSLADTLNELASYETNTHKMAAYVAAATAIFHLPFKVKSGEELASGPKKLVGIGKSISRKIDEFIESGKISKLEEYKKSDVSKNVDLADAVDKLASLEEDIHKRNAYRKAADAIYDLPFTVTSGKELSMGPKKVSGIGKSIARKIDEFIATGKISCSKKVKFCTNDEIAWHLDALASLEGEEHGSQDKFKIRAYRKAAKSIRDLDFEVTNGSEISHGPNKIDGIGKGIAKKIDELLVNGEIERLEELTRS